ncbi:MAG: hypothetical protein A2V98_00820 [Planctomycetes bacterium RBG_16_64_12]|nr:MAG: hypothetical protein A2V98_00820 [Planctomycetes bacterium RBG_16_64_12]
MYPIQIAPALYLMSDPPLRYLNHSCDPNAGIRSDLLLVALRTVKSGDEISFDYSTTMLEEWDTMLCECGAPNCRRVIADFSTLSPEEQRRYVEMGVVMSFISKCYLCRIGDEEMRTHSITRCVAN